MSDGEVARVEISDGALGIVAGYSALAGLCPLIPVPFLDDVIIERIHRRLAQVLCGRHDFYLSQDASKLLTSRPKGLLSGAITSLVMWPIKKILRKLIYVLAIKSCADVAAALFHEGWLLARALEQEYVSRAALGEGDDATMRRLRDAIAYAHKHVDPKPTRLVMSSAFGVGRQVIKPMLVAIRQIVRRTEPGDERIDAAEDTVAPISERIQAEIKKHWSNGPALDNALREALAPSRLESGLAPAMS